MSRPANTPDSIRARVYDAIVAAADAGEKTPSILVLREALRCDQRSIYRALSELASARRIERIGAPALRRYRVTATGRETIPARTVVFAKPKPARPARPCGSVNLRLHVDQKLTAIQRNTLSVARKIIRETGSVRITELARTMGLNDGQACERLQRIAGRGHLRQMPDKSYIAAEPRPETPDGAVVRLEQRPGLPVPVKIIAPALATGAHLWGSALGTGGIAMAGGGFRKFAGRA